MSDKPDPALDAKVCEFLGIKATREHDPEECDLVGYDWGNLWRGDPPKCTCTPTMVYPPVSSSWNGFGMVVKRLDEVDLVWTKDIVLNTENMQEEHAVYLRNSVGQNKDLRRALALAVAELAGKS